MCAVIICKVFIQRGVSILMRMHDVLTRAARDARGWPTRSLSHLLARSYRPLSICQPNSACIAPFAALLLPISLAARSGLLSTLPFRPISLLLSRAQAFPWIRPCIGGISAPSLESDRVAVSRKGTK